MVHPEIRLTTREKLQFLWLIPLILLKTALTLISAVLTDTGAALRHPVRTVGVTLLRHGTRTLSFRQKLAADVGSTGDVVRAYCAARGDRLAHSAVPVPVHSSAAAGGRGSFDRASTFHAPAIPDATLHLITTSPPSPSPSLSSSSPSTILYLHGGGFVHPVNAGGQLAFARRCAEALRPASPRGAATLAVLEYHLAPARRHPAQLAQALAALRALVVGRGVAPGRIALLGDSAGGNLLLGVLAALGAGRGPEGAEGAGSFGGDVGAWWRKGADRLMAAAMVSPWCGLGRPGYEGGSYAANARWDFLGGAELGEFEEAVGMGRARGRVWGDAVGAARVAAEEGEEERERDGEDGEGVEGTAEWGGEFWSGVVRGEGRVVDRMLVSVGTREVLYDDVVELVRLMGTGVEGGDDGRVVFVKGPREVHVGPIVDVALGVKDEEGSLPAILEFFKGL